MPIPTAYRHVALLKELQLVEEGQTGRYHPTAKVMPLARAAQMSNSIARIAAPIISDTSARLRETVMLIQRLGDSGVCIERTECDRAMRFTFQLGHTVPLGLGASGKMLLACLPKQIQHQRLGELGDSPALERAVAEAMEQGYATSHGELDEGVWACSVPVNVGSGGPYVLTVAGPGARISDSSRLVALEVLRQSATTIADMCAAYAL